jgi:hypothetical protein
MIKSGNVTDPPPGGISGTDAAVAGTALAAAGPGAADFA